MFLYESRWSIELVFPSYISSWDGSLNLDEPLILITMSMNGGFVYHTKVTTVTSAFAHVLMASILVCKSLIF